VKPPAVHDTPPGEPPDGREGAGIGQVIGPHRRGEQRQGTAESRSTYSWPVSASFVSPLRVGLVGHGLAGAVFHAPLNATTDGLVPDTVVTDSPPRRPDASAAYPGSRLDVLEAVAASSRKGRTVRLDGRGG